MPAVYLAFIGDNPRHLRIKSDEWTSEGFLIVAAAS
jgi:hypothetical protein